MSSKDQIFLRLAPHLAHKHPEIFQALLTRHENSELLDAAEHFIKYEQHAMSQPAENFLGKVRDMIEKQLEVVVPERTIKE